MRSNLPCPERKKEVTPEDYGWGGLVRLVGKKSSELLKRGTYKKVEEVIRLAHVIEANTKKRRELEVKTQALLEELKLHLRTEDDE